MAPLRLGEGDLRDQAPRLHRVVVRDRRLEVLPLGRGLPQLAAQPAEQAHGRLVGHGVHATACRIFALPVDLRSVDELETALRDVDYLPDRGLATAVLSRPAGAYAQSIVIAAGRNDGVRVDDPVVTQDGLVGKGSRTSSGTARVTLLTDDQSAASALDVETDAFGIVRPGNGPRAPLRLDRVPKEARVRYGDTIVTSGWSSPRLSSLYPRGIRIGRVTSVGRTDTDLYTQVQVTPFADLTSLESVLVLIPQDRGTP